jgi:cytochrome c553
MKQFPIGFSTALAGLAALALSFSFPSIASAQAQTPTAGNAAANPAGNQAGKLAMCMGCHGIENYRTAYPEVYRVPKINGQSQEYLVKALQAYRSGDRRHPTMRGIAVSLSDQDMAELAAYYAAAK